MLIDIDSYFMVGDQYVWSPQRRDEAWRLAFSEFERALVQPGLRRAVLVIGVPGSGKSTWARAADRPDQLLFDAVFSTATFRKKAIDLANSAQLLIDAAWLETPLAECLRRNSLRPPDRRIDEQIIRSFQSNFDKEPPSTAEGFREVQRIRTAQ